MPIKVVDTIKPDGLPIGTSLFPTVEDIDILGGYQIVGTDIARNNIPSVNRKQGMLVYVVADSLFYQLAGDLVTWNIANFGSDTTLSGDVTGLGSANTVTKIQGVAVSTNSVANDGYALISKSGAYIPQGIIPVFNVKNFGAKGDGVTNDTSALNSAVLAASAAILAANQSATVYFPPGTYLISSPINVYSRVKIVGSGHNGNNYAKILASGGFTGASLFNLVHDSSATTSYYQGEITGLHLSCVAGSGIAAMTSSENFVTNCHFHALTITGGIGIQFPNYAQMCIIEDVFYVSTIDQMLKLCGNINTIKNLDNTGVTAFRSTSSLPLIHLTTSAPSFETVGNIIEQCVVEGFIGLNQTPLRLEGTQQTVVRNFWVEDPVGGNGHYAEIVNCVGTTSFTGNIQGIGGFSGGGSGIFIIYARTSAPVIMDSFYSIGQDITFQSFYDFDSTPFRIKQANLGYGDETYKIIKFDNSIPYVEVEGAYNTATSTITNLVPQQRVNMGMYHNLLTNGSFDAGLYGWTVSGASGESDVFQAGTVGPGQGWHSPFNANPSNHILVYQTINIDSAQLHVPLTFSIKAQIGGTSWANIWIDGCGVTGTNLTSHVQRFNGNQGWSLLSQSFIPQTAGVLHVGVEIPQSAWHTGDVLWLDEANLCFGLVGNTNQPFFGSLVLNSGDGYADVGIPQLYGAVVPSTGTWAVGSIVWNNSPTPGGNTGWICTTAGSPGTWKSFGNISYFSGAGSLSLNTFTVTTSTYTIDSGTLPDYQLLCNRAGTITITLPVPTNGRVIVIKDASGNAVTNNITISHHSTETIDGATTFVINNGYQSVTLSSDGTNWFAV